MTFFSLIAHPRSDSFCHAISETARRTLAAAGHSVIHHDLYAEGFDPCLKASEAYTVGDSLEDALARCDDDLVRVHRQQIASANGILIVHPNWWGKPPAILAGWMDRVLVPGVAYRLQTADGRPDALLDLKHAVVFNTSDTVAEREQHELGDPLHAIWTRCVLPYCGAEHVHRQVFRPVVGSTDQTRANWLSDVERVCKAFSCSGAKAI
ncbi:MAG: NAD(P)H-dependent oxidoreductase [Pseudomonadota bacterium]